MKRRPPDFKTPTDLNGLFTGYDPDKKSYDRSSWKYQLDAEGNPKRDLTLKDPRTVFQLLRRHYSRYTIEMVEGSEAPAVRTGPFTATGQRAGE